MVVVLPPPPEMMGLVIVVDDGVGDDGDGGDCLFCSCDKNTIAKAAYRRTRLLGLTV